MAVKLYGQCLVALGFVLPLALGYMFGVDLWSDDPTFVKCLLCSILSVAGADAREHRDDHSFRAQAQPLCARR